ncbi:prepilin-type N-terminal cleavage/methylation domain-containing protein (plasmid) [Bacillus sp. 31A1R]|uniref:Prepilin-type N-terminal cleavage/methylation domain-containing protein n=1 Tax=Robertmurraya mangrovi TaxID=3098077 RepID=A0ABU5IUH3_9BACI|nr:prepilin-type N-terminal cleavage/methylation domain-containing protein [Bacillus sp. 31A1R]MDZ5470799.1 prepilin-type N-terminal cleavage/methylation domain-containing protein [Bacillus sp. 31A1R]
MNKLLKNNQGMTLIEVLITLVIMTIISTVIYSVFITGIKLYQKIGIEGKLRDDADYIATMLLNVQYENSPNYVDNYSNASTGDKGIQLTRLREKTVNRYLVEDSNVIDTQIVIYFDSVKNNFFIKKCGGECGLSGVPEKIQEISTEHSSNSTVTANGVTEHSYVEINQCTKNDSVGKCKHGIISLNLVLTDSKQRNLLKTEPIILKSTFGF